MSEAAGRVIIVAGALMPPLWVPPAEVASRLPHLSALADLQVVQADAGPSAPEALPRELAHDRWLRAQPALQGAGIHPGAMSAVRRLARYGQGLSGWLLEPAHFHLAKDHVVLIAGAAHDLSEPEARELADALMPLMAEESFALEVLAPAAWLLTPGGHPLQVEIASSDAAAGRNVDGYLPKGADERRYRKLLNEVQMTWHEHPVNQRREERGRLPINSVWLSGPVVPAALAAWSKSSRDGRFEIDDTLLESRLRDDRSAWLDALQALDARLADRLAATSTGAILLCGDEECRWLRRGHGSGRAALSMEAGSESAAGIMTAAGSRMAGLAGRFGALLRGRGNNSAGSGTATAERLAAMFTEGPGNA